MQRASRLAQSGIDEKAGLSLFDTGDDAEAAAGAAARAVAEGAPAILGPLFARQVRAVAAAAAGAVPVIAFSNSPAAPGTGVFTFGITPSQSVSAILRYARGRGVRRVALVGDGSLWSEHSRRAGQLLGSEIGLQMVDVPTASSGLGVADLLQKVRGGLADAALLTGGPAQFQTHAPGLRAKGVQVLGTMQALQNGSAGDEALEGAWLSAPDPAGFARFEASFGSGAGMLSALAFDATGIIQRLQQVGQLSREGLLHPAGFQTGLGAVRFRPDGRCVRELAIVAISAGALKMVSRKAGL